MIQNEVDEEKDKGEERFWKVLRRHPLFPVLLKSAISIILFIVAIGVGEVMSGDTQNWLRIQFYIILGVLTAILNLFIVILHFVREARNQILIATKIEVIDKLQRKLIETNAIIPYGSTNKISITARDVGFYEEDVYKILGSYHNKKSIDLIRTLSYQNLILTPRYINYLFFKRPSEKVKLVIIQEACQATLCYLTLCLVAGYDTYVLPNKVYKKYVNDNYKDNVAMVRVLKGNPYLLESHKNDDIVIFGKYTDFRDNDKQFDIPENICADSWDALDRLVDLGLKVKISNTYNLETFSKKLNERFR